ncbi:MAG TPA: CPBP family intramembrane metalloprotease [Candidatus Blautia stercoravium]|nr:CPBP family intramembrane metalloprotease [Candidatus Blautia stercoravium]
MKKVICILKSLLPMLFWLGIQSAVSSLFLLTGSLIGKGPLWAAGRDLPYVISVLANGITFLLGYLWLQKRQKENSGQARRFSLGAAAGLLVVGVAFQLIVSLLLVSAQVMFPKAMESYAQVLENLGVFAPSLFSVLYTVVFAPLTEEMVFRGMTLRILEEELPFAAANVLQAVLFALIHGNLVQSSYAFLAGLLLGYVVKRYGKISAAVWCHFAVNASGLFLGDISPQGTLLLLVISAGILLIFVIIGKKGEKKNIEYDVKGE